MAVTTFIGLPAQMASDGDFAVLQADAAKWFPTFTKESELRDKVAACSIDILDALGLPPAVSTSTEYMIGQARRRAKGHARVDVLCRHEGGLVTVFEVKRIAGKHDVARIIGQLLMYEELFLDLEGVSRCNLVAVIDGALHPFAFALNARRNLGIHFVLGHESGFATVTA